MAKNMKKTLRAANNYAVVPCWSKALRRSQDFDAQNVPVARRVLGENHELTLQDEVDLREGVYEDPDATLDDIREAAATLEDTARTARRVPRRAPTRSRD